MLFDLIEYSLRSHDSILFLKVSREKYRREPEKNAPLFDASCGILLTISGFEKKGETIPTISILENCSHANTHECLMTVDCCFLGENLFLRNHGNRVQNRDLSERITRFKLNESRSSKVRCLSKEKLHETTHFASSQLFRQSHDTR